MRLVLASASPRRCELLRAIGLAPIVAPADLDESALAAELPDQTVFRLARAKVAKVSAALAGPALVIGADTVVVVEGQVLGKPADREELRRMVGLLAGRQHEVFTGVAVLDRVAHRERAAVCRTAVEFSAMSDAEIDWYVATGEGLDKAGGYAIQGVAALFIPRIQGSWSNVVGLPLELLYRLVAELGHELGAAFPAGVIGSSR